MTYSGREHSTCPVKLFARFPAGACNQTDVFAVHGADPEVLAYAMARYSRSALSMRESLAEISAQRAEQFLNTFYFQYGHRSIADLAHIAFAVERLSLLAAIVLVDETALGRPGTLDPLPEFHEVRLVFSRVRRRCSLGRPVCRHGAGIVRRLRSHLGGGARCAAEARRASRRHEARGLRAHVEGPRL